MQGHLVNMYDIDGMGIIYAYRRAVGWTMETDSFVYIYDLLQEGHRKAVAIRRLQ